MQQQQQQKSVRRSKLQQASLALTLSAPVLKKKLMSQRTCDSYKKYINLKNNDNSNFNNDSNFTNDNNFNNNDSNNNNNNRNKNDNKSVMWGICQFLSLYYR